MRCASPGNPHTPTPVCVLSPRGRKEPCARAAIRRFFYEPQIKFGPTEHGAWRITTNAAPDPLIRFREKRWPEIKELLSTFTEARVVTVGRSCFHETV